MKKDPERRRGHGKSCPLSILRSESGLVSLCLALLAKVGSNSIPPKARAGSRADVKVASEYSCRFTEGGRRGARDSRPFAILRIDAPIVSLSIAFFAIPVSHSMSSQARATSHPEVPNGYEFCEERSQEEGVWETMHESRFFELTGASFWPRSSSSPDPPPTSPEARATSRANLPNGYEFFDDSLKRGAEATPICGYPYQPERRFAWPGLHRKTLFELNSSKS